MAYSFSPKTLLVTPKSFGRRVDALWKPYDASDPEVTARVLGAYLQHLAACETTRLAFDRGWGMEELHTQMGDRESVHTLRRKLYGEAPATFIDLGAWMDAVGQRSVVGVLAGGSSSKPPSPPTETRAGSS